MRCYTCYKIKKDGTIMDIMREYILAPFFIFIFFFYLYLMIVFLSNAAKDTGLILFKAMAFTIFLAFLILYIFLIINTFFRTDRIVLEVCINKNKLYCKAIDQRGLLCKKTKTTYAYPFNFFTNNLNVSIQIHYEYLIPIRYKYLKIFSFRDFLNHGYEYIEDMIKSMPPKKRKKAIISIVFYKYEKIKPNKHILTLNLSLSVIDLKTIKEMLNEWKEKYERYIERQKVERGKMPSQVEAKRKVIRKSERKAIHIVALSAVIAFAIITFILLSLIPYLNTPPHSTEYDKALIFLIADSVVTAALIIIGIIQIPRLYKKLKGEGSKNEVVHQ